MTSAIEDRATLGELEERTAEGRREMAAARVMVHAAQSLSRAFELSGRTQKDLAHELGVSEGRVSQVLHGDGNVRLSTLARYLRAMGYVVELQVNPADNAVPPLRARRRRRGRRASEREQHDVWAAPVEHDGRFGVKIIATPQGVPPMTPESAPLQRVAQTSTQLEATFAVKREVGR
ncbi:helix-turn-helix domain-containing protein [Microbacterium suaedae]|uniref:helix-turn-helix domain-containing protein n=1 Tax=Microbacterium suaedae TaxID=2067813 RepID=UPI0013A63DB0|nr:helix-turn-helix transcriptional regulator [Microbacterium suaedae]